MEAVANGNLTRLNMPIDDREIASLANAFNHVLRELELRHLLRSEKLASLGTMLSGVAHELNNPLSNISSSCQILMEEIDQADPEFRREMLGQIDEQTIRARNIVRSLLDFARDREFKAEPLHLARLVEESLRFLKGQTPPRVAVSLEIPPDLVLQGDKQRLQQVVLNLVKNALEALEGAGEVRITAARRKLTGDAVPPGSGIHFHVLGRCKSLSEVVDIEISDNGMGIPPEILPRIFDPFFTTKEVGKGSGLGLFVVFQIIEEHGGCTDIYGGPSGKAETILGKALVPRRGQIIVATKFGAKVGGRGGAADKGGSRDYILQACSRACSGSAPTMSICTSITFLMPARRSRKPCAHWRNSLRRERPVTSAARTIAVSSSRQAPLRRRRVARTASSPPESLQPALPRHRKDPGADRPGPAGRDHPVFSAGERSFERQI